LQDTAIELRIAIQDDVAVPTCFGEGFTQLLDYPLRIWMSGHVEVQNLPSIVLDNEEAIEELESRRRHGEEVERSDYLAVIRQECQPLLARVSTSSNASEIPADACFRDDEAELLEFTVDLGRAPSRILLCQAADECTDFSSSFRSAASSS
jgi:hypothetical protein